MRAAVSAPTLTRETARDVRDAMDALTQYERELARRPRLPRTEEDRLGRLALRGDVDARNALAEGNARLVPKVVRKFLRDGLDLQDLIQAGNIGLLRAAEKWDPDQKVPFGGYAPVWVERYAREVVAADGYATKIPLYRRERFVTILAARTALEQAAGRDVSAEEVAEHITATAQDQLRTRLEQQHGRAPTDRELAEVRVTARDVDEAIAHAGASVELDAPAFRPDSPTASPHGKDRMVDTRTVDPHARTERRELELVLREAIDRLGTQERFVLIHYWGLRGNPERTLEQIGVLSGMPRERVRTLKDKALRDLGADPMVQALGEA